MVMGLLLSCGRVLPVGQRRPAETLPDAAKPPTESVARSFRVQVRDLQALRGSAERLSGVLSR